MSKLWFWQDRYTPLGKIIVFLSSFLPPSVLYHGTLACSFWHYQIETYHSTRTYNDKSIEYSLRLNLWRAKRHNPYADALIDWPMTSLKPIIIESLFFLTKGELTNIFLLVFCGVGTWASKYYPTKLFIRVGFNHIHWY